MKYTRLGDRGPEVSTISFGAWAIGGMNWGKTDDEVSKNALRTALDQGVTLIDTADVYGFGHSETLIAEVMAERGKGKEMQYAEGYRVVTLVDDETWEKQNGGVGLD